MPPEVSGEHGHPGKEQIGFEPKYDIYSIGAMLLEIAPMQDEVKDDFIKKCMDKNPKARLSVANALRHPYMAKQRGESKERSVRTLLRAIAHAMESE